MKCLQNEFTDILFSLFERGEHLHLYKRSVSLKIMDIFCYLCKRYSFSSVSVSNAVPSSNGQSCQTSERFRGTLKGKTIVVDKTNRKLLILW